MLQSTGGLLQSTGSPCLLLSHPWPSPRPLSLTLSFPAAAGWHRRHSGGRRQLSSQRQPLGMSRSTAGRCTRACIWSRLIYLMLSCRHVFTAADLQDLVACQGASTTLVSMNSRGVSGVSQALTKPVQLRVKSLKAAVHGRAWRVRQQGQGKKGQAQRGQAAMRGAPQ